MAENLIETPLPAGTPFAADLVDFGAGAGNTQRIKIADATEGSANGLTIGEDGSIQVVAGGSMYGLGAGFMGEMALGESAYAIGDQVSDGVSTTAAIPSGVYRCASVKLLTSAGTPLPDGIGLAMTPYTAASAPTWGVDGDVYAPPPSLEALYTQWVRDFDAPMGADFIRVSLAPTVIALDGGADTIRFVPFTTELIASVNPSDSIIIVAYLERIGSFVT